MKKSGVMWVLAALTVLLPAFASPTPPDFTTLPCTIIAQVWATLASIVPALILVMFTYGAVKYLYGAEDPGARKQGKNICISAILGGILFLLASAIFVLLQGPSGSSWWKLCPGVSPLT